MTIKHWKVVRKMGEVADMHIDGTLCQYCGLVFDDIVNGKEAPGYPRSCTDCEEE